ncbi:hypothetical protein FBU30_008979 [Linnemannia zychae]|nr:hypothetical protein FBU30_008979 [Linnemannia zychae]
MSCESCTGCFEATPCNAPSPSLHGHISKEYRHFLKAARTCNALLVENNDRVSASDSKDMIQSAGEAANEKGQIIIRQDKVDHAFSVLISILANNQFTAQTYLALAYKQLGPSVFLQMSRNLAHHGFWGRLLTWAFLYVKEDSERLRCLVERQDPELLQTVNDEAEMFEVFNPAVNCQRVQWNIEAQPSL